MDIVSQAVRKNIRSHFYLPTLGVGAPGKAVIRRIGEWVQDAGWEMDNSIRHGRQKAVNRSNLWHLIGICYWFTPPLIMINGNFDRSVTVPVKT